MNAYDAQLNLVDHQEIAKLPRPVREESQAYIPQSMGKKEATTAWVRGNGGIPLLTCCMAFHAVTVSLRSEILAYSASSLKSEKRFQHLYTSSLVDRITYNQESSMNARTNIGQHARTSQNSVLYRQIAILVGDGHGFYG